MELVGGAVLNAEVIIWFPSLVQDYYSFLIDFNWHLIRNCESPVANSYFTVFQGRLLFLFYNWLPNCRLGKLWNAVFDSQPLRVLCTEIVRHRLRLFISSGLYRSPSAVSVKHPFFSLCFYYGVEFPSAKVAHRPLCLCCMYQSISLGNNPRTTCSEFVRGCRQKFHHLWKTENTYESLYWKGNKRYWNEIPYCFRPRKNDLR